MSEVTKRSSEDEYLGDDELEARYSIERAQWQACKRWEKEKAKSGELKDVAE